MVEHGTIALTVTSPVQSFVEPISLAEAKAALHLPEYSPTDAEADAMIEDLITASREQTEIWQGRDLVAKQQDLTLDYFPGFEIELREPLESVDLVTYRDSDGTTHTLAENTDYIVDLARALIMPPYGETWPAFTPWPSSAVTIRFTTAAPGIRREVIVGMKYLIKCWYNFETPDPMAMVHLISSGSRSHFA